MEGRLKTFAANVKELKECANDLWKASQQETEVDTVTFPESESRPDHLKPLFELEGSFPRTAKRSGQGEANAFQKRYDELAIRGDQAIEQLEDYIKSIIDDRQQLANDTPERVSPHNVQQFTSSIDKMKMSIQMFIGYSQTVSEAVDQPLFTEGRLNLALNTLKEFTENVETYVKGVINPESNQNA